MVPSKAPPTVAGFEADQFQHHIDTVKLSCKASSFTTMQDAVATPMDTTGSTLDSEAPSLASPNGPVPIAICGMAMRLPGGIDSSEQFWDLLVNKRDARCRVPADRYDVDSFYSTTGKSCTTNTTEGYFLEHVDLARFDASLFSMTRNEVEKLDPQQLLLLELTRECLENAGETGWRGSKTGCYVGTFNQDWSEMQSRDDLEAGPYRITGTEDFVLANRISYEYDLRGPSFVVKTACSSSLICVDLAVKALQAGDISSAIVGGANLIMNTRMTQALAEQGVLSPNGSCLTFDAEADGYARAEAVNMVYLKRLDDALRDGNPVRAVIRATATNFDGKTQGIAQPSAASHEALIRDCYRKAGLTEDMGRTALVEAHGTGTQTGDSIETTAIANIFGDHGGVYIGSVKPNLGHSEGASGLSGLIKSVLALEHKTIPPNIKFDKPNPKIPFDRGQLRVPVEATPWPTDRHERISLSSFGIGGANAHVILDSAESLGIPSPMSESFYQPTSVPPTPQLLVFTGAQPASAQKGTDDLLAYLEHHGEVSLQDVAYTLGQRREHLDYRSFAVADGRSVPLFSAPKKVPGAVSNIVFVFTGQGSQWATMGAALLSGFPSASSDVEAMDKVLSKLPEPLAPAWSLRDELLKPKETSNVNRAEFSQPLCTCVQIAIVNLLREWGITPSTVVGHSSGEIAAAYASGALTAREAIVAAYLRGLVMRQPQQAGAMAAVGLGRDGVQLFLEDGVTIACENSPSSVTLSGDADKVDAAITAIKEEAPDVFVRRLQVEMAYHSHHMKDIGEAYERMLAPFVSSEAPSVPLFSSVTNEVVGQKGALDAAYWRRNLESPVLFHTAVKKALTAVSSGLVIEIGPHSALAGPLRQIMQGVVESIDFDYLPTLVRGQNGAVNMLALAGELFTRGFRLDLSSVNNSNTPAAAKALTDLPNHPWHYDGSSYWYESRLSKQQRRPRFPRHDLLGARALECGDVEPVWRNVLRLTDVPWLRDHMVGPDIVFPAAGYMAMAGEAVCQMTGSSDFTLSEISIGAALVLRDAAAAEMVFGLRPVRLTTGLDSAWFEFTVSSYNGAAWAKHCTGRVRGGRALAGAEPRPIADLARKIPSAPWYQTWRKVGLNYGPRFQGLERISAHPGQNRAVAHLVNRVDVRDSEYQLHPATIDCCLQLFMAAACRGRSRALHRRPIVPTYLGEVYIRRAKGEMAVEACADYTVKGGVDGSCLGVADGETALVIRNIKLSPVGDESDSAGANKQGGGRDAHAGAHLVWRPHIAFQELTSLMRPPTLVEEETFPLLQRLTLACSVEACERLAGMGTPRPEHLRKFAAWLRAQVDDAAAHGYPLVDNQVRDEIVRLSSVERGRLISDVAKQIQHTEAAVIGTAVHRVFGAVEAIFGGEMEPLAVLREDDILTALYDFIDNKNYGRFLSLLSHAKPNLRVLEVGAGTGATTEVVLGALDSFDAYVFTDISAGFFPAARERFSHVEGIEFQPLDIGADPAAQGFQLGSFDLVIATNVLHATPHLHETLVNVRRLLRPDGMLLLQELSPVVKWFNFVMGILPGWWLGEADGRRDEPYVRPERWLDELHAAGFGGVRPVKVEDKDKEGYEINITWVASNHDKSCLAPSIGADTVSLLTHHPHGETCAAVASALQARGITVETVSLSATPRHDVICLLDLEENDIPGPFLNTVSASPDTFAQLQTFITALGDAGVRMLWLTRACQVRCTEPDYARILGLARTVRNELLVDLATLELASVDFGRADGTTPTAVCDVFAAFRRQTNRRKEEASDVGPDYEYALIDGVVHVPRFHPVSIAEGLAVAPQKNTAKRLEIVKRGTLKGLQWVNAADARFENLEGNEVVVDVRVVGMNFKDILTVMGVVDGQKVEGNGLGVECSGVITAIGPDVEDLQLGDRVCVGAFNTYATRVRTTENHVVRMPNSLSFEDGATMPSVFGTVIHSLLDLVRLQSGQSLLIHSACGGIGIAAIYIARMVGADIYATVGSDDKVAHLVQTFGIPRERIFHSRDVSFVDGVMRATAGRGVDVVLNALSGDLLHASWQCVAPFGSMVDISKRDIIGHGRLAMDLFEANRSFFAVDLAPMYVARAPMLKRLLERTMDFYRAGAIKPIHPVTCYHWSQLEDGMRFMQTGQHMGKILVRIPEDPVCLTATASPRAPFALRGDVSYLLVGGLGGLGRLVATWMAESGARHLIFLSRSGNSASEAPALKEELSALGCSVRIVAGSVADLEAVRRVAAEAQPRVGGVVQLAMVLRDAAFPQMTHQNWEAVMGPKVQGTWNLHEAFSAPDVNSKLDFFVLFGSSSGVWGNRGQANYAAANTFLDAFVQYRHRLGQPASVMDVGIVGDVGYVSQNQAVKEAFQAKGAHILGEQEILDALELAILRSAPLPPPAAPTAAGLETEKYVNTSQLAVGLRVNETTSTAEQAARAAVSLWGRDPRFGLLRHRARLARGGATSNALDPLASLEGTDTSELDALLAAAADDIQVLAQPSASATVARQIGLALLTFMMKPVESLDVAASPVSLGIDSLMAIELRNWCRQRIGAEVSVLEIMGAPSIQVLAEGAVEKLVAARA